MPEKKKDRHTLTGGINTVLAKELLPPDSSPYILNCNVLSSAEGNVGVVTNIKGNTLVSTPLPLGENRMIGFASDEERNNFYFAVRNSNGRHTWFRYNNIQNNIIKVYQDITDSNGVQNFRWTEGELILHADIVRNGELYWTIKGDIARKLDINKALDETESGYNGNVLEEFTRAAKKTSNYAPTAVYFSNPDKPFNRVYGYQFKFSQRYIYDNNEKSNVSDYSNVPNPTKEPYTGINIIPTDNNGIRVTLETGIETVDKIEVFMLQTNPEGGTFPWVSVAVLDKRQLNISSNATYDFDFYNDGSYAVADAEKIIRPYSFLPKEPLCQAFVSNAMVYANFKEGFPVVDINASLQVTYEPLFIEPGTVNEFNKPLFSWQSTGSDYALGPATYYDGSPRNFGVKARRTNLQTITVGSDVKKGNIFSLRLSNGRDNYDISYEAKITDNALTVAGQIKQQIINTGMIFRKTSGLPDTNIFDNTIDSGGNVSFSYLMAATSGYNYIGGATSVNPVSFNSLKDTGQSVKNGKMGSTGKLGIMYEDEELGRKSLTYTDESMVFKIDPINTYQQLMASNISLTIRHRPPSWAKFYQIVRSRDLTYENYIQILIQKVTNVQSTIEDEYLDLQVGSLFTYQKIHENTTLRYEFRKGDRIRLIKKIDPDTSAETYYPFYETEIISYKQSVTTLKNENVSVNGTNQVTVAQAFEENIGSIIRINGSERTITGLSSGTVYQVDNNFLGGGGNGTDVVRYASYEIINNNGVIRIKKPATPAIVNFSLIEVYTPSLTNNNAGQQFFEFGYKFPVLTYEGGDKYHGGNPQNQTASVPAILNISSGTAYVKNRELPTSNVTPNTQVVISAVEDPSYSDFYISDMNDNGRANAQDTGDGEVHFGSRFRFSNNFIEDTKINGLNDFDNLDREDYNDKYGDVKRLVVDEKRLYTYKELKTCWIPVFQTILTDAQEQEIVGTSSRLLNNIQYFSWEGGIGNNPEAFAENGTHKYHLSPNSGVVIRLGGNGEVPISEVFHLDNKIREYINESQRNGSRIYLGFDRKSGCLIVSFESSLRSIYVDVFNEAAWQTLSPVPPSSTIFSLVQPPTNGTLDFTDSKNPIYTPDTNYTGKDSFTYSAVINGDTVTRKVCIDIPDIVQPFAWRQKQSSFFCVTEGGFRTGFKGWSTLEQYGVFDNQPTGQEKPNDTSDIDYVAPILDNETCVSGPDAIMFTAVTDAPIDTETTSNTVTISGLSSASALQASSVSFDYSIIINGDEEPSGTSVSNGDTVALSMVSSEEYETEQILQITINDKSFTWSVTTEQAPPPAKTITSSVAFPAAIVDGEVVSPPEFPLEFEESAFLTDGTTLYPAYLLGWFGLTLSSGYKGSDLVIYEGSPLVGFNFTDTADVLSVFADSTSADFDYTFVNNQSTEAKALYNSSFFNLPDSSPYTLDANTGNSVDNEGYVTIGFASQALPSITLNQSLAGKIDVVRTLTADEIIAVGTGYTHYCAVSIPEATWNSLTTELILTLEG